MKINCGKYGIVVIFLTLAVSTNAVTFNLVNDSNGPNTVSPLFSNQAGTLTLTPGNTATLGDGALVNLIALQGGTNYILGSFTIGDTPGAVSSAGDGFNGIFDVSLTPNDSVVAGAVGSTLALQFFSSTSVANSAYYGIISNNAIKVPGVGLVTTNFYPDVNVVSFQGPRTTGNTGWYTDTANPLFIPEPSTLLLVGIGMVSLLAFRRQKS